MNTIINLVIILVFLLVVLSLIGYLFGGGSRVYAAILLNNYDGSGETKLVGVFRNKVRAESILYQHIHGMGYEPRSEIIECIINKNMLDDIP